MNDFLAWGTIFGIFLKGGLYIRKSFLKIVSAATAVALALTIAVCSAAAEDGASTSADSAEETAVLTVIGKDYAEKYEQFYKEAVEKELADVEANYSEYEPLILAGVDVYGEARKKAEKIAQEECEKLGLYMETLLTPMENVPYKGWRGELTGVDIENSEIILSQPERFICTVGNRTASITGRLGFYYMYKKASVTVTYDTGATSTNSVSGTAKTVSATASSKSGTITKGDYTLSMFNGTEYNSGSYEVVLITLVS